MANIRSLLVATGLGSAAAFFFDPRVGRRRRALVRDKVRSARRRSADAADAALRDLRNRGRGLMAETRARLAPKTFVADDVLAERARARLGLYVSHPHAIEIRAADGIVIVGGPILMSEAPRLVAAMRRVRGARDVDERLELHETADIPVLQGAPSAAARPLRSWRSWPPAAPAMTSVAAVTLALASTRARKYLGSALAVAAVAGLSRGLSRG